MPGKRSGRVNKKEGKAPGKRTLPRESEQTLKPQGRDASGPAKDAAPQQSRHALRTKG